MAERLARVRERIAAAGGDPDGITVIAMTKGFEADAVRAALAVGLDQVGENYAQELVAKAGAVDGPSWHFLGRLQRNKVRSVAGLVSLWQSVDRMELMHEIAKRAPGAAVLVQVNVSGEPQKGGCDRAEAEGLVAASQEAGLDVRGLMAVGPTGAPEDARPAFRWLAELGRRLDLPQLSMGMTEDLEVAVQEGATMVRIGRALFGPRLG